MKFYYGYARAAAPGAELDRQRRELEDFATAQEASIRIYSDTGPASRFYCLENSLGTGLWTLMCDSRAEPHDGIVVPSLGLPVFGRGIGWIAVLIERFRAEQTKVFRAPDPTPLDLEALLPGLQVAASAEELLNKESSACRPSWRSRAAERSARSSWGIGDILRYVRLGPALRLRRLVDSRPCEGRPGHWQDPNDLVVPCQCPSCSGLMNLNELEGLLRHALRRLEGESVRDEMIVRCGEDPVVLHPGEEVLKPDEAGNGDESQRASTGSTGGE